MALPMPRALQAHLSSMHLSPRFLDGVFAACGVAPAPVPPSRWLEIITPPGGFESGAHAQSVVALSLAHHNAVQEALHHAQALVPGVDAPAEQDAFVAGFVEGARLSPEWFTSVTHMEVVARCAHHVNRQDLVPERLRGHVEAGEGAAFRNDLPTLITAARVASRSSARMPHLQASRPDVGRNEKCPCGSGKKFKHCCGSVV